MKWDIKKKKGQKWEKEGKKKKTAWHQIMEITSKLLGKVDETLQYIKAEKT